MEYYNGTVSVILDFTALCISHHVSLFIPSRWPIIMYATLSVIVAMLFAYYVCYLSIPMAAVHNRIYYYYFHFFYFCLLNTISFTDYIPVSDPNFLSLNALKPNFMSGNVKPQYLCQIPKLVSVYSNVRPPNLCKTP
jgi:hypothetical protein